tara:strand:+ start:75 stop:389 length:315 start_codon:yes stop_codon:yes gene_type:complete
MSLNHYMTYLEEWERFNRTSELNEELRSLIDRIKWNKRILCSDTWTPTKKDIIIHKERFNQYLKLFNELDNKHKINDYNYFPKRMKTIKESIIKIRNYENKGIS